MTSTKKLALTALATICVCCFGELAASSASAVGAAEGSHLDLGKVFKGAPIIYTVLFTMSISSFVLWLYSLLTLRLNDMMPEAFINTLREQISERRLEAALVTCQQDKNFSSKIIACGLAARRHGSQVMIEAMHSEGRRAGIALWQRISLLNDVAVIAPMLGLLGTVLGMFFAFYDTTQAAESLVSIFDGLGIAIGTTVAGLIVAILSMFFYTSLKFRLTYLLNVIENEALSLVNLIDLEQGQTGKSRK